MSEIRVVPGVRWSCHATGFCCHHYVLGPVEPEIIAGLQRRGAETLTSAAGAGPWFTTRPGVPGTEYYLAKTDDHCVFLRQDGLCSIHAAWGSEAKPAFCREFPFYFVEDPKGLAAVVRPDCAGCHTSALDGEPVAAQIEQAWDLPRQYPVTRFAPERVVVAPGFEVPLADWMADEDTLIALVGATPGGPGTVVSAVRDHIFARAGRPAPPADQARYHLAARAGLEALYLVVRHTASTAPDPGSAAARYVEDVLSRLERARARATDPWPSLELAGQDHLRRILQATLLGKRFQARGSVAAGLGLFLLDAVTARLAAGSDDGVVSVESLAAELTQLSRLTLNRSIHEVLDKASPALVDLFLYAPR